MKNYFETISYWRSYSFDFMLDMPLLRAFEPALFNYSCQATHTDLLKLGIEEMEMSLS